MPIDWRKIKVGAAQAQAGSINWGQVRQSYEGQSPTSLSPIDQKVVKSFQSLPAANRKSALERLDAAARKGDGEARRKLGYLSPIADKNIPQDRTYSPAPTFKNGIVNAVSNYLTEEVGRPLIRGGEQVRNISNATSPNPAVRRQAQPVKPRQLIADAAQTGLNVAGLGRGIGLFSGAKTLGAKILGGAASGAGYGANEGAVSSFREPNTLGDTARKIGTGALVGGIFGGVTPAVSAGASKLARGLATRLTPVSDATTSNLARTLAGKPQSRAVGYDVAAPAPRLMPTSRLKNVEGERPDPGQVLAWKTAIEDKRPIEPIIAKRDSMGNLTVEDGKHRLQAYKELGYKEVPVRMANEPTSPSGVQPRKADGKFGKKVKDLSVGEVESTGVETAKSETNARLNPRVAQDIDLPSAKLNLSSRSKHFDESLQDTIKHVEKSPGYREELAKRGGDQVIPKKHVYEEATRLGPVSDEQMFSAKPLEKVDTVTVARAKATVEAAARDLDDLRKTGVDVTSDKFLQVAERFGKLNAGYKIMTGEAGRALGIQADFVSTATKLQERVATIIETTKGPNRKELIDKAIDEAKGALEKGSDLSPGVLKRMQSMLAEYATAAKLTSPLTHVVNITSSLLNLPVKGAEDVVKVAWGAVKGETSLKQLKYTEVAQILGMSQGARNAVKQLGRDLKQSIDFKAPDLESSIKADVHEPAIPGAVGKAIRTPFNLLTAGDNFFKNLIRDSELHQQAYTKAFQEGFRGNELARRISELVATPTDQMAARAETLAKEFTFTSDPGPVAAGIVKILGKVPVFRLLVPFVQTPTNLATFQARRSALGIFSPRNIQDIMAGGMDRRDAVARLAVGTGMSLGGLAAVFNLGDGITGAAPTNKGEKDLFYGSGKKPYSIKVGDRWVAYNRFQPIGLYLTQAVALRDGLMAGDKSIGSLFQTLVVTTAKGLADLPFVSGISDTIEAIENPDDMSAVSRALGNPLTGLIPNVSRDVANAGDPVAREAKSVTDQAKMMIPGLREQVKPRVDVFGQAQNSYDTSGLERGFLKITSKDKESELSRALNEIGKETGYYPQPISPNAKVQGRILDKDEFTRYQALAGNRFRSKLEKALADSGFENLDAEDKQRTVETMVTDSKKQAAEELFGRTAKKGKAAKVKRY